ncbi:MAG: sulfotransferase [Candidatus Rokubacteria bacterium]|nr:sulfotransferase [Candidatus Rokubacteria bacterium]
MLPNFLVLGAEKTGTTWLYFCLQEHPEVYVPRMKEVHFFDRHDSVGREVDAFRRGLDWYSLFFRHARHEPAVGEVTPTYLHDDWAPRRIQGTLPGAKLVAIVREPIARAHSHYWMDRLKGDTEQGVEVLLKPGNRYVERSLYAKHLRKYLDLFPREQLLVLVYEEMRRDPERMLRTLFEYLGVDPAFSPPSLRRRHNEAGAWQNVLLYRVIQRSTDVINRYRPGVLLLEFVKWTRIATLYYRWNRRPVEYEPLPREIEGELAILFEEPNRELQRLTGLDLSAWRDPSGAPARR